MNDPYDYIDCQNYPHNQFNYNSFKSFQTQNGWIFGGDGDLVQINDGLSTNNNNNNSNTEFHEHNSADAGILNSCFAISDWDIKDAVLPQPEFYHSFEMWPDGDCHLIYNATNNKARKHKSGWAMRNTNNHNKMILKKSCLGVIKCSKTCWYPNQNSIVRLAPKISEAARRCQLNKKPCPNPDCDGFLIQQLCTGKSGNPVTHYWRYNQHTNSIYFMARGSHDHEKPNIQIKMIDKRLKCEKLNFNELNEFLFHDENFDQKFNSVKYEHLPRINPENIFNIPLECMYSPYVNKSYQQLMIKPHVEIFPSDLNRNCQYISPVYNSSVSNSTDSINDNWNHMSPLKHSSDFVNDEIQRLYCPEFHMNPNNANNMEYISRNIPFEISWNNTCAPQEQKVEVDKESLLICEELGDSINKNQIDCTNFKYSFRNELEMLDCFTK